MQMKDSVEGLTSDGGGKFALEGQQGTTIDLKQGATRVSDEEEEMAMETTVDPEDQPEEVQAQAPESEPEPEPAQEEPGKPEQAPDSELSPEEQNIMNQFRETIEQFPDEYSQACWDLGLEEVNTVDQAKQVIDQINTIMDAA
jgi:hypothetical protein